MKTMIAHSFSTNLSKGYTLRRPFIRKLVIDRQENILISSHIQLRQLRPIVQAAARPVVEGTIPFGGKGLAVDQYAHTQRAFLSRDICGFSDITGDHNALHQSLDTGRLPEDLSDILNDHPLIQMNENGMTKQIVPGILLASLFSCIFGTIIPGSVYQSQRLEFRRPVFVDELVVGRVHILKIEKQRRLDGLVVRCSTHVTKEGKQCVQGEAKVWIRHGTKVDSDSWN